MIGTRGTYQGTDGTQVLTLPRNVDPDKDGTSLAAHRPPIFDVTAAPDSIAIDAFDHLMEAAIPVDVIQRIDRVIASGVTLAAKGLADQPPLEPREWRRGIILSWSHARDLEVVHDAMGHPRYLYGRHDVDEVVLASHLKARLASADPWYADYVTTLDDGAWTNIGFFNPHLSASLYKWGDAKQGVQNAMDAHRLAAHHLGSPEAPLDWIERAINFIIHHIPREHMGIRHEPRGQYSDLEEKMATDPAMKDSEIGKQIARDAAKLYAMLERDGKVVPWGLLKVPQGPPTASMIEHAFLIAKVAAPRLTASGAEGEEPARLARAETILADLPKAIETAERHGRDDLVSAYRKIETHG